MISVLFPYGLNSIAVRSIVNYAPLSLLFRIPFPALKWFPRVEQKQHLFSVLQPRSIMIECHVSFFEGL